MYVCMCVYLCVYIYMCMDVFVYKHISVLFHFYVKHFKLLLYDMIDWSVLVGNTKAHWEHNRRSTFAEKVPGRGRG